ncbi:hypothetical protein P171DRAFT_424267 [Karstenula rhodostoma CBS 690.94]|uniref:Uncharacterized protein n=1 Tax=Karstenula rhodostoma CBS 690.94 TaxID=1392251 RepID=A0A9P4U4P4_9PLEO|nr:hypothetical protein P171DRAFT_424267 [Karstenula rhodostoma CBS 690.94]
MDTLARYAHPPFNYLGTTLFLSYILLALYFTLSISTSLYAQYKRLPSLKLAEDVKNARTRHIKIYAFLASISFAILSYNMLNFLIQSLTVWARTQNLLGRRVSLLGLRYWMLETNLFETFAQELVSKRPNAFWTQAALLETWFWNVWMAYKAQQHKFSVRTMVPYIVLGQILPITFTASLFLVQLHLDAVGFLPDLKKSENMKTGDCSKAPSPVAPDVNTSSQTRKTSLVLPTIIFNAALMALSSLRNNSIFIPLVLFTRLLLLVLHTGRIRFSKNDLLQSVSISFGFFVANITMSRGTTTFQEIITGLRNGGFATKTLGYDAEFGLLLCAILRWGGGV